MVVDHHRGRDGGPDGRHDGCDRRRIVGLCAQKDDELVAAYAKHLIRPPQGVHHPLPCRGKQLVPALWPRLSLTSLKPSRSMKSSVYTPIALPSPGDGLIYAVPEQGPVRQPGERVMMRHEADLLFRLLRSMAIPARRVAVSTRASSAGLGPRISAEYMAKVPSTAPLCERIGVDQHERSPCRSARPR
jgi:hypothetical protein